MMWGLKKLLRFEHSFLSVVYSIYKKGKKLENKSYHAEMITNM